MASPSRSGDSPAITRWMYCGTGRTFHQRRLPVEAVRARAEAEVGLVAPVDEVVAALEARAEPSSKSRTARSRPRPAARTPADRSRPRRSSSGRRLNAAADRVVERRAVLDGQAVERDVLGRESDRAIKRAAPGAG